MIEFNNVSLIYPNSQRTILENLNFRVEPGELVLVIGLTGAGKSSFIKLVNGLIPQLIISIQRIKIAQRMRGIKRVGFRNWQSIAAPVIEESLDRAIDLAANLESKGFGYHQNPTTFKAIKMVIS